MKKYYSHIFITILSLSVSCTALESDEGTVSFTIDENIPEPVSVSLETKAAAATKAATYDVNTFLLNVEGTDISGVYGEIKGQSAKLKVGTYTVNVRSNADDDEAKSLNDGYGAPCYAGSAEFEVEPLLITKNVTVECNVSNARVVVELSEDFKNYFDESKTSVRICEAEDFSSRALAMLPSQDVKEAYYTTGDPVYVKVTTSKIDANTSVTYTFRTIESVAACTSYTVSLSHSDSQTGGITFTVAGNDIHTNDQLSIENYKEPTTPPVAD